jgi:predicted lipoprotein with Yx(FWY)xxD motif
LIRRRSVVTFVASAAVVPALILSACGSDNSNNSSSTTTTPNSQDAPPSTVDVAETGLGNVLVDSQGRTLYRFLADQGTTSECSGACATNWPPLEASGKPTAGKGADPSMIGTTARSDGGTQVTYNGHPVYTFMGDKKPGDTNGEGLVAFGAGWFALSPAGVQISSPATTMPPPPPPTTTPPPPPTTPDDDAAPAPDNDAAPAPAQGCGPGGPRVPQNGGGDGDADNNGGPDDGDGGV